MKTLEDFPGGGEMGAVGGEGTEAGPGLHHPAATVGQPFNT